MLVLLMFRTFEKLYLELIYFKFLLKLFLFFFFFSD